MGSSTFISTLDADFGGGGGFRLRGGLETGNLGARGALATEELGGRRRFFGGAILCFFG